MPSSPQFVVLLVVLASLAVKGVQNLAHAVPSGWDVDIVSELHSIKRPALWIVFLRTSRIGDPTDGWDLPTICTRVPSGALAIISGETCELDDGPSRRCSQWGRRRDPSSRGTAAAGRLFRLVGARAVRPKSTVDCSSAVCTTPHSLSLRLLHDVSYAYTIQPTLEFFSPQ